MMGLGTLIRHLAEPIVGRSTKDEYKHARFNSDSMKQSWATSRSQRAINFKKGVPVVMERKHESVRRPMSMVRPVPVKGLGGIGKLMDMSHVFMIICHYGKVGSHRHVRGREWCKRSGLFP